MARVATLALIVLSCGARVAVDMGRRSRRESPFPDEDEGGLRTMARNVERVVERGRAVLGLVGAIWVVSLADLLLGGALKRLGIEPRDVGGLVGIPLAPFLHRGLGHLASNTVPLLVLGAMVALRGVKDFWWCTLLVTVVGGLGVWLFARPAIHVGASGVVFGYLGFLVSAGWFERRPSSIAIALLVVFLYSGVLWGILPGQAHLSWEAHLFGLAAGVLAGWISARRQRAY
jgi:membrane associated rhomboid family serine protease